MCIWNGLRNLFYIILVPLCLVSKEIWIFFLTFFMIFLTLSVLFMLIHSIFFHFSSASMILLGFNTNISLLKMYLMCWEKSNRNESFSSAFPPSLVFCSVLLITHLDIECFSCISMCEAGKNSSLWNKTIGNSKIRSRNTIYELIRCGVL